MTRAILRPLVAADAVAGHALTTAFGWPHRLEDWTLMARLGAGTVAEYGGEVVGTALRWAFGDDHATIGLIGVHPGQQGRGLGRRLTGAVLGEGGTTMLHATEAGLPLYASLGFQQEGTVRQLQGNVTVPPAAALPVLTPAMSGLRPMEAGDAAAIRALDREATGMDRAALIDALLGVSEGVVLGADGFALLRAFGRGEVIGPVVARDAAVAAGMIRHLLASRAGCFVRIDLPEESGLLPLAEAHGLGGGWPAVRMVRGTPPVAAPSAGKDRARVFALASQAWG